MAYIKADNETEQKHFDYLEKLRQSGVTNMWGAAPYLMRAFPKYFKPEEASECLVKWMKLHDDDSRVINK